MFNQIFGLLFAITYVSAADNNDTELTERYFGSYDSFPSFTRNRCLSRTRQVGKCVPLQNCPELRELSKKYNPMYILQAVSDYTCGFTDRTVQVCCPERNSGFSEPLIDPYRPSNNDNNAPIPFPGNTNFNRPNNPRPFPGFDRPNSNNRPPFNNNNNFNRPNSNNNFQPSSPFGTPFNPPSSNGGFNNPRPFPQDVTPEQVPNNVNNNNNGPIPFPLVDSTTEEEFTTSTTPKNRGPKKSETTTETNSGFTTIHRNRRLLPESTCGIAVDNKIIGGRETSLEEYPWMALIRLRFANGRTVFSCGGSILSPRYILTAAHCIKNPEIPPSAVIDQVRLGEYDQDLDVDCTNDRQCSPPTENIDIEERIVHSKYNMNDKTQQNDIALLRLKRPAKFSSYVLPICLPIDDISNKNYDGERLWTAGWGKTSNGTICHFLSNINWESPIRGAGRNSQSSIKLKVDLPIIPFNQCASNYKAKNMNLQPTQICAGGEANRDSCQGDSGGPLMSQDLVGKQFRWHVQGIVSIGPQKCGTAGSPGIYTKVADYIDWILDNMRE